MRREGGMRREERGEDGEKDGGRRMEGGERDNYVCTVNHTTKEACCYSYMCMSTAIPAHIHAVHVHVEAVQILFS